MSRTRIQKTERELERALAATGLPYAIEPGRKHKRIILAGRMIGVFSYGVGERSLGNANIIAAIKREARKFQTA